MLDACAKNIIIMISIILYLKRSKRFEIVYFSEKWWFQCGFYFDFILCAYFLTVLFMFWGGMYVYNIHLNGICKYDDGR